MRSGSGYICSAIPQLAFILESAVELQILGVIGYK
jgi:hypothetical protein